METMSSNKRIAKNTVFLYGRMLFVLFVSLFSTRVVLNTLGVEDYGIYNVVAGFVSMFSFLNASLTACIQRYYNYENGQSGSVGINRVFIISMYIEIALALVIFAVLQIFGQWFIDNKLVVPIDRLSAAKYIFKFSTLQLVLLMIQVPYSALVLSKEHMDYYAIVGVIEVVLKLILIIILPYIPYDKLIIYGLLSLSISILNFLLYFGFVRYKYPGLKLRLYWDKELCKSMLTFSWWNIFGAIAMVARTQGLNILLNSFFGPIVNAARGVAFQVQSAIMGFIQNITVAARPQMVESYAVGNIERASSLMLGTTKICFILLYMMVLPVSYEINYILNLWLGANVPEYTSIFTILVLVTSLIDVLNTPVTIIVMASGKISLYCSITSLIGLSIIPLSLLLLKMGYSPVVVFTLGIFISIIVQVASLFIMKRETGLSLMIYCKSVVLPIIVLVIMTVMIPHITTFMQEGIVRLIATIVLSTFSILIVSYYVCLTSIERNGLSQFIKSSVRRQPM